MSQVEKIYELGGKKESKRKRMNRKSRVKGKDNEMGGTNGKGRRGKKKMERREVMRKRRRKKGGRGKRKWNEGK